MSPVLDISIIINNIKTFFRKDKSNIDSKIELKNIISKNWKNLNHLCIYFDKTHYKKKKSEESFSFERIERQKFDGSSVWKMYWNNNDDSQVIVIMKVSFNTIKETNKNYEIEIYKEFTNKFILTNKTPHLLFYIKSEKSIFMDKKYYCFLELLRTYIYNYTRKLPESIFNSLEKKFSYIVMEYVDSGSLKDYIINNINNYDILVNSIKIFFFQIIFTFYIIHSEYPQFKHNDLSCENILLSKCSNNMNNYYLYKIKDKIYKIKNIGYQIHLYDFDQSDLTENLTSKKVILNNKNSDDINYLCNNIKTLFKELLINDIVKYIEIIKTIKTLENFVTINTNNIGSDKFIDYHKFDIDYFKQFYEKNKQCSSITQNLIYNVLKKIIKKLSLEKEEESYIEENPTEKTITINIELLLKYLNDLLKKNKENFNTIKDFLHEVYKKITNNKNENEIYNYNEVFNNFCSENIKRTENENENIIDKYNF